MRRALWALQYTLLAELWMTCLGLPCTERCHDCPQSERRGLQLRGRISELEAELAEQRHLKQQAMDDSEFLRTELEELKKQREDTEKAQRSLTEIESEEGA